MIHALSFVFRRPLHLLWRRRHIIAIILVMQCLHEALLDKGVPLPDAWRGKVLHFFRGTE